LSFQSNIEIHAGQAMLKLFAWIRRQPWLQAVYQRFPQSWRARASQMVVERNLKKARLPILPVPRLRSDLSPADVKGPEQRGALAYSPSAGVNIFAYFRGQFGLGESARLYARALIEAGYPVALHDIDISAPHGWDDRSLDHCIGDAAPYRVNLIFINPDYLAQALASIDRAKMEGRYVIACWFWELERIPDDWLWAVEHVDEIMVASEFVERAFRQVTDKPILRVPVPIGDTGDSGLTREQFGLPIDSFIFLSTFDFNSWWHRKNPIAAIRAFRLAFPRAREDVRLLIKSSNGHRYPEQLHQLLAAGAGDPRILIRDDVIDRSHVHALHRCADAYVSLHRAEGFGLGLAEAMALGKPVIGTAWSGNLEFMTAHNSCLVDYRLVPVGNSEYVHAASCEWAEPDIGHAAACMERVVSDPAFARSIGDRAARDIRDGLSPAVASQRIIERLDRLATTRDL
jgi:glycosyltransferase involved in cell wall biosynthesis